MPVFAIVPVQRLELAKSRLAPAFSAGERRALVIELLDNVLCALTEAERIHEIVVVSPDRHILERSAERGAIVIEQTGRGLNEAIHLGRDLAIERGADTVLVLLADLPGLTASEIDDLVALAADAEVTLAPDRHGHGTNALVLQPPDAIEPAFGVDSFHVHLTEALRLGRTVKIFKSNGTAFDVDTVDDLMDLGLVNGHPNQTDLLVSRTPIVSTRNRIYPPGDPN